MFALILRGPCKLQAMQCELLTEKKQTQVLTG